VPGTRQPAARALRDICRWHVEELAYLLARMKSVPEGDGTLLDHTVLLFGGAQISSHSGKNENMPFIVAGGGSGRIRTGQYLQFSAEPHVGTRDGTLHAFGFDDERRATTPD